MGLLKVTVFQDRVLFICFCQIYNGKAKGELKQEQIDLLNSISFDWRDGQQEESCSSTRGEKYICCARRENFKFCAGGRKHLNLFLNSGWQGSLSSGHFLVGVVETTGICV
jgi:hypothetical protein